MMKVEEVVCRMTNEIVIVANLSDSQQHGASYEGIRRSRLLQKKIAARISLI